LKCFESPSGRKNPIIWKKRQSVRDFINQKPMFTQLMQASKQCMMNHPELKNNVKGAIACETIHPATMSQFNNYTFHTHPHNIPYPSDVDKDTTRNLKKKYLLIGVVPQNRTYVFSDDDNFTKAISVI
jgi:DNA repair protein RadC